MVFRWCLSGASVLVVVFRCCLGIGVLMVVLQWCSDGVAVVVFRWFSGGVWVVVFGSCFDGGGDGGDGDCIRSSGETLC